MNDYIDKENDTVEEPSGQIGLALIAIQFLVWPTAIFLSKICSNDLRPVRYRPAICSIVLIPLLGAFGWAISIPIISILPEGLLPAIINQIIIGASVTHILHRLALPQILATAEPSRP